MKNVRKGFTLIELLVVIAIIGILSAVVLASLNNARNKGADAAVKANLANARAEAELFYDSGQTYAGVCATTGNNVIGDNVQAAISAGGEPTATVASRCSADANEWVAWTLTKTAGVYTCVDYKGAATTSTIAIGTTTDGDQDCD
jgi:prepilin-type N-terminal cleavage/methylation domain-containing protein